MEWLLSSTAEFVGSIIWSNLFVCFVLKWVLCLVVLWFSCIMDLLMVNNGKDSMHVCFMVHGFSLLFYVWSVAPTLLKKGCVLVSVLVHAFGVEVLGSQIHNQSMREVNTCFKYAFGFSYSFLQIIVSVNVFSDVFPESVLHVMIGWWFSLHWLWFKMFLLILYKLYWF